MTPQDLHVARPATSEDMFRVLILHLRERAESLRKNLAHRITESNLLASLGPEEVATEAGALYDGYVDVLETGRIDSLLAHARGVFERFPPERIETSDMVGVILLLRDVVARSLFQKYQAEEVSLSRVLDTFEPEANRIAVTVSFGFLQERERVIVAQQDAIRELSTPVLKIREQLLILPVVGVVDPVRARQLTDQLLRGVRRHRAKVAIVDITGVPTVDAKVANDIVLAVQAVRLLGATVIVTGLSSEIAQTLVGTGVDLGRMNAVGDLQGGMEEAERLLGYVVVPAGNLPERQVHEKG